MSQTLSVRFGEFLLFGGVAACLGAAFAPAQIALPAPPLIYTSGQATQGAALYTAKCAICHGAELEGGVGPALSGTGFIQEAAAKRMTAKSLFDLVANTMPSTSPRSLKQDEYEALVAFVLSANGYAAGNKPLRKDDPELEHIALGSKTQAASVIVTH